MRGFRLRYPRRQPCVGYSPSDQRGTLHGGILTQLRGDSDASLAATVDRIAREVEQLRRQLAS
ncbi:MAG: hypothetical protein ACR2G2_03850 [Pseudonocardia sp.]